MSYADRSEGIELTKLDPYFHEDADGQLWCRVITDDGQIFRRLMSRKSAARIVSTLALWMERTE